jgi:predicted phosphodiesterase
MELHVLSDIHLEFAHFNAPQSDADVIVLAGDIGVGVNGLFWAAFQEAFMGKPIVYVSGNHEYYGTRLERTAVELRATAKELGIHYLDNDMTEVLGVTFIGATLWSDFELFGAAHLPVTLDVARTHLTDCGRIVYGTTGWIRPEKMIELHRISRRYLENTLKIRPRAAGWWLRTMRPACNPFLSIDATTRFLPLMHLDWTNGWAEPIFGYTATSINGVTTRWGRVVLCATHADTPREEWIRKQVFNPAAWLICHDRLQSALLYRPRSRQNSPGRGLSFAGRAVKPENPLSAPAQLTGGLPRPRQFDTLCSPVTQERPP